MTQISISSIRLNAHVLAHTHKPWPIICTTAWDKGPSMIWIITKAKLHLLMLSNVSSSLNNLAKPSISSLVTDSPIRTCLAFTYIRKHNDCSSHLTCLRLEIALFINSSRSSAVLWMSPLLVVLISSAICLTVSCKNFAYSILAFNFLFNASCEIH